MKNIIRLFAAVTMTAASVAPTFAQFTWTGAGDGVNWSDGANWAGGVAPTAGSSLVFTGTTAGTIVNDFAPDTTFNNITFPVGSDTPFVLTGNAIRLSGDVLGGLGVTNHNIQTAITLLHNATFAIGTRTNFVVRAGISGDGFGIIKTGNRTLILQATTSYTGPTVIRSGGITVSSNNSTGGFNGSISSSSALIMGGLQTSGNYAATLTVNRTGGEVQTFNGTTFNAGVSVVNVTKSSGATSSVARLNLGTITRETGSVVLLNNTTANATINSSLTNVNGIIGGWAFYGGSNFATVNGTGYLAAYSAYTTIADKAAPVIENNAANNLQLRAAENYSTTLAAEATGGTNTIEVDSTANMQIGDVVGISTSANKVNNTPPLPTRTVITDIQGTTVTLSQSLNRTLAVTSATWNVVFTRPVTLNATGTVDVNTLHMTDESNRMIDVGAGNTLRLGSAGAIVTVHDDQNEGGLAIVNGNLTAGGAANTAGEIVVRTIGNSGTTNTRSGASRSTIAVDIGSNIVDNGSGAVTLTKFGSQQLKLTGNNTYSGGTYVLEGTVVAATVDSLGTGPVYVHFDSWDDPLNAGQVQLRAAGTYANDFYLAGKGGHSTGGGVDANTYGALYLLPGVRQ